MSGIILPSGHQRYIESGPTTKIWDPVSYDWTSAQGLLAKSNYKVSTKWDTLKNCVVAVKSIPVQSQHDVDIAKNEFELMKQLHHRNILRVLDCVVPASTPGEVLIVMKYISEGSLQSCIKNFYADASNVNKVLFGPDLVFRFFVSLLSALDCLEKNHIIHRDIKMANLLFESQSETVILTDFDRSRQVPEDTIETITDNITRLSLQPPEHLSLDNAKYSHKSDMWSLGCTMMEIATGRNPWTGEPAWKATGITKGDMRKWLLEEKKTPPIPDCIRMSNPVFDYVIQQCFLHNPSDRWSAVQALEYIQKADGGKFISYIPTNIDCRVDLGNATAADDNPSPDVNAHLACLKILGQLQNPTPPQEGISREGTFSVQPSSTSASSNVMEVRSVPLKSSSSDPPLAAVSNSSTTCISDSEKPAAENPLPSPSSANPSSKQSTKPLSTTTILSSSEHQHQQNTKNTSTKLGWTYPKAEVAVATEWECPRCTLLNPLRVFVCQACSCSKPNPIVVSVATTTTTTKQGQDHNGRCPKYHALKDAADRKYGWLCDGCGKNYKAAEGGRYRCQECDYDICQACRQPTGSEMKVESQPGFYVPQNGADNVLPLNVIIVLVLIATMMEMFFFEDFPILRYFWGPNLFQNVFRIWDCWTNLELLFHADGFKFDDAIPLDWVARGVLCCMCGLRYLPRVFCRGDNWLYLLWKFCCNGLLLTATRAGWRSQKETKEKGKAPVTTNYASVTERHRHQLKLYLCVFYVFLVFVLFSFTRGFRGEKR